MRIKNPEYLAANDERKLAQGNVRSTICWAKNSFLEEDGALTLTPHRRKGTHMKVTVNQSSEIRFTVRTVRAADNSRLPVLFSSADPFPVALPMRYIATEFWKKANVSPNTIRFTLQAIAWFHRWGLQYHGKWDLEPRLLEPLPIDRINAANSSNYVKFQCKQTKPLASTVVGPNGGPVAFLKAISVKQYLQAIRDYAEWAATIQATPNMPESSSLFMPGFAVPSSWN